MLVLLLASSVMLAAQTRQFTGDGIDYILELPSPAWQVVSRLDVHVAAGRTMYGRIYYLQMDPRTFYALRFTVARNKLQAVRDQMDLIARSFRLK